MSHCYRSRHHVSVPEARRAMPVRSFSFKESLHGTSIYTSPGRTGAHGYLSLQEEFCKSDCFFVFLFFFPVCVIENSKGEGDCVWLLGGQSTESFIRLLLFPLSWCLKGTFPRPVSVVAKSTICSARTITQLTWKYTAYLKIFLGTWICSKIPPQHD